jgi:SAM-dependent methyltransferase
MRSLDIFRSPNSGKYLKESSKPLKLFNDSEEFVSDSGVLIFLDKRNDDYEGAYLGKAKYIPKKESFPYNIPLWMMMNGFVWEVRRHFKQRDIICELGCASGVNYFGQRYNMIGLDFSLKSLKGIENYNYKIQADALRLPFKDNALDGIISAYFWEHINPYDKPKMLEEFKRVLKPSGKVIMLYDVETNNGLISRLKRENIEKYEDLFLKKDFHIGYESLNDNLLKFQEASFKVLKHFGMERTWVQSTAVYTKLKEVPSWYGTYASILERINSSRMTEYLNILLVRVIDVTLGKLYNKDKSRIAISVLQK